MSGESWSRVDHFGEIINISHLKEKIEKCDLSVFALSSNGPYTLDVFMNNFYFFCGISLS